MKNDLAKLNVNKPQTTAYLYIALTLITVSFFGYFAIRPAFSTITNLQRQLTDSKNVHEALQAKLSSIQSLEAQYRNIRPELPLIYEAIPQYAEIPSLTRQIETLTQENGLEMENFSVSPIEYYPLEGGSNLYSYTFTVQAVGSRDNISQFIEKITNFNRLISLDRVITGNTEQGAVELTLSGKAYFQKQ